MNISQLNRTSVHITVLVLVVFVFYVHTFNSGFMFDDYAQQEMLKRIKNNQREMNMFNFITTPEEVKYFTQMTAIPWWTSPKWSLKYFRPVATFSHLIDYSLWGSNPLPYHVNNVIWYAMLVLLVYLLYLPFSNHAAMAFCGALVFALEPCHYFTVRWAASRNDIICATFLVASLIFYLRFHRRGKALSGAVFIIFYLLALLTKELAFLFPVLVVAYDLISYKRVREMIRCRWKTYLVLSVINSVYLAFYQAYDYGSYWYGETSFKNYLLEFLKASSLYLISLFYGGVIAALSPEVFSRYWFVLVPALLFLCWISYLIWKQRKHYPEVNLFFLWIVLLLPFIVVPPINDRLLLIPSIGYAYLAALAIFKVAKRSLAIFFITIGLLLPPITNSIQARTYDEAVLKNYERLYSALDDIVDKKTPKDRLFFINFPRVGLAGENYIYLGLYHTLYYHFPQWGVPIYPLSVFDDIVSVELLDDHRMKIYHPTRFYFETNTEKLFSLDRAFAKGEVFLLPDIKITIAEMEGAKVKALEIEYREAVDNPYYYFLYFNQGKWLRWHPLRETRLFRE